MRIAMVGVRGVPARSGGAERVVEHLSAELARLGHEVVVYARAGYVGATSQAGPIRVIRTAGLGSKHTETITHTASAMFDVLRRNVDVVHIHSPGPALLSWIPAAARKPIVLTVHAPDWRRRKWSLPAKLMLRWGLRMGMRFASAVTAVSGPLAEELSAGFGREVHHVPNAPVLIPAGDPKLLRRWGLAPRGYALYVGRIEPEKRVDLLMEAWREVGRPVPLVVVGRVPGNSYGRMCRAAAAGLDVRLIGPQFAEHLGALYAHAMFLIQPSVLEGMSMVLLEAAAHGTCILAADIPENRRAMGESILYFDTDDCGILVDKIRQCVDEDALRARKGEQARRLVQSAGSWSETARQMAAIYRAAVS